MYISGRKMSQAEETASVHFSHSVVSNSLWPHGLQHARPSYPSSAPGVYSKTCPLSGWCHIEPPYPLLSPSLPVFNLSQHQGIFKWVSCLHHWPKYWSWSFSISPSNRYSGLISFRMDWLDLLVVQGTLKNLLQHHSSKASILWCSTFFMVQLKYSPMASINTLKWKQA